MISYPAGLRDIAVPQILYENLITATNATFSSETPDGFGLNCIDGITYDHWTPASAPAEVDVTLDQPQHIDCVAIDAHNFDTSGTTITVQGFKAGGWVNLATASPTDRKCVMLIFESLFLQRFRIVFTGGVPSIGVLYAGRRLAFACGVSPGYTPTQWGVNNTFLTATTQGGHFIGNRLERRGAQTTITPPMVRRDWFEANAVPFLEHFNEGKPFIYADSPVLFPDSVGLCWPNGDTVRPQFPMAGLVNFSMEVSAYVRP